MSQARGRYAGSRRDGQRQPHHDKKSPPQRPGPPYVKAPPQGSALTASIFKTRSFQFLVDAVGAENIAIALDSNMTRVAELMKGERFTPETAFHMETTLGLPHGFFDQPNPALAPETIARLKSPLDFIQIDEGLDAESEALEPASALNVDQQPVLKDSLSEEAQMPKKVAGGSPGAVRNGRSETAGQPRPRAPRKVSPSKDKASPETPQQQPVALSDSAEVENIRRANELAVVDSKNVEARAGRHPAWHQMIEAYLRDSGVAWPNPIRAERDAPVDSNLNRPRIECKHPGFGSSGSALPIRPTSEAEI